MEDLWIWSFWCLELWNLCHEFWVSITSDTPNQKSAGGWGKVNSVRDSCSGLEFTGVHHTHVHCFHPRGSREFRLFWLLFSPSNVPQGSGVRGLDFFLSLSLSSVLSQKPSQRYFFCAHALVHRWQFQTLTMLVHGKLICFTRDRTETKETCVKMYENVCPKKSLCLDISSSSKGVFGSVVFARQCHAKKCFCTKI